MTVPDGLLPALPSNDGEKGCSRPAGLLPFNVKDLRLFWTSCDCEVISNLVQRNRSKSLDFLHARRHCQIKLYWWRVFFKTKQVTKLT